MHKLAATCLSILTGNFDCCFLVAAKLCCYKRAYLTSISTAVTATARGAVRSNAQQENEVHIEKHGSTAGIWAPQIPTIAPLHHHAHAIGARSRTNSQPNPFSRAARASSFSRRSSGLPVVLSFTTDCAFVTQCFSM